MTDVTINSKEYGMFKDATVYNFLQRKYQFKQKFSLVSIREHIRYMQEIYDIRLDQKTNKDIYDYLIALDNTDIVYDNIYVPYIDITLTTMDIINKKSGDLLATTICGFHYGEPDEQSLNFMFDNIAVFDDHIATEDEENGWWIYRICA